MLELLALNPKIVLVPLKAWNQKVIRNAMNAAAPTAMFVPVPQMNSTVVNCHLKAFELEATTAQRAVYSTPLATWMNHLVGFNKPMAWRFIGALKSALKAAQPSDRNTPFERRSNRIQPV